MFSPLLRVRLLPTSVQRCTAYPLRQYSNYPPPGSPDFPSDVSGGDSEVGTPNPEAVAEQHNRLAAGRPNTGEDVLGSVFDGTSRAAHRRQKAPEYQEIPVLPGTGAASLFPGSHATDPLSNSIRSGVEGLRERAKQVRNAGQAVQSGSDHAEEAISRVAEKAEEAVDRGASVASGTAHDVKEGTAEAGKDAREKLDYTSQEAQELYSKAAKNAEEAAARASKEGRRITPQGSATEFEDDPLTRQRT